MRLLAEYEDMWIFTAPKDGAVPGGDTMAVSRIPSVFVSSTCFDLAQVRDDLRGFIQDVGYDAVLSEYKNFPVNPDVGTIENCREVVRDRIDIFVLVVGGRYGSVNEQGKSVTNLEFVEARAKGIPTYAFVQSRVLSILPVWKSTPTADFSAVVDSPKLLEFVDSLYSDGEAWVFPFENARDIIATLRSQWAYLFLDSLNFRAKARDSRVPEVIRRLHGTAYRIAIERPRVWEYRLFSRVLADELSKASALKRDHKYGVTFQDTERLDSTELFPWITAQLEHLVRVTAGLTNLINVALPDAVGPAGAPGDPESLVYVAEKIAEGYRTAIQWALRFKRLQIEDAYRPLALSVAEFTSDTINKVERFSEELENGLAAAIPKIGLPGEPPELILTVIFSPPDTRAFEAELSRLSKSFGIK